jgi:hypothetical protein
MSAYLLICSSVAIHIESQRAADVGKALKQGQQKGGRICSACRQHEQKVLEDVSDAAQS